MKLNSPLAAVVALINDGPSYDDLGVCHNLSVYFGYPSEYLTSDNVPCRDGYDLVMHFQETWPYTTGSDGWPIPDDHCPPDMKWEGEAGWLRYDLCHHIKDNLVLEAGIY